MLCSCRRLVLFVILSYSVLLTHSARPCLGQALPPASDSPPPLRVNDVLRSEVIDGADYRIVDPVVRKGHRLKFRIETTWGPLHAEGVHMLQLRLSEMPALARVKAMQRSPQLVKGVFGVVENTPRGAGGLLTDPAAAVLSVPEGIRRAVESRVRPEDRRAGGATRRRLALELGCDPETSNPLLKDTLSEVALRRGAGGLAGKVGLSMLLPGLGLIPASAEFQRTITQKLPHEIHEEIEIQLLAIGTSDKTITEFLKNNHFTTTQRLLLATFLTTLEDVDGRSDFVEAVARARNDSDALATLHETALALRLHQQRPLQRLTGHLPTVATQRNGGTVVIYCADYLPLDADLSDILPAAPGQLPPGTRLMTRAHIEPQAIRWLQDAGCQVLEDF